MLVRVTAERAGANLSVVKVFNESRNCTAVVVPTADSVLVGLEPAIGSQAPELMEEPSCSITVGSEFK